MSEIDIFSIQSAAEHTLNRSISTKFSKGSLNETDVNCIAEAIANAINEYDKQCKNDS